jgi:photosystem II stability/assembly factor-like uncharacterized protein
MTTVLYLGTDHGAVVLSQTNGGWQVESQALKDWTVSKVVVDPNQPEVAFAATRGDGVWRTDDRGQTWKKPSYGRRGPGKLQSLTLDSKRQRLYAGAEPIDVYVSEDAGRTWHMMDSVRDHPCVASITYPVPAVEPHVRDIAVHPQDPDTLYLALQVGYILKTTDGGQIWELLDKGIDSDVHTIAINPSDPDRLLIATGGHDSRLGTSPGKALFASADGGQSWKPVATEFDQEYSIPMVVDPCQPNVAYSALAKGYGRLWKRPTGAEAVVIRSHDRGETWERLERGLGDGKAFASAIAVDAAQPGHVYAATSAGQVLLSQDGGDSWTELVDIVVPTDVNDLQCASV